MHYTMVHHISERSTLGRIHLPLTRRIFVPIRHFVHSIGFLIFFYFIILLSLNQSVVLYIADSIKKWLIHASTLANRTNPEYECERVMLHSDKREKCVSDTHSRCFTTTTTIITIYECVCVCASLTSRHRVIISFLPINILGH